MSLWAEAVRWIVYGWSFAIGYYLADCILTRLDPFGLYEDKKD